MKDVKIVATIGPSSFSFETIKKMKENGLNIARINTKWGDEKQWESMIQLLHRLGIEIMIDVKSLSVMTWVNSQKINYLAVSYAQSKLQIKKIRGMMKDKTVRIISKIETKAGLENIDNLIEVSDGIMVARGDLSRNIPFEKVPYYKKLIIDKCKAKKVFVIVATEMLLSMINSKVPTNAEVEDVFSAVVEGGSAVMLSEESAIGKYPTLSVKTMRKIVCNAEKYLGS